VHPQSREGVEVGVGIRLRDSLLDLVLIGSVQLIVEALERVTALVDLGLHRQLLYDVQDRVERRQGRKRLR
jgi:hypothetical protein